jgi:hypothetical protein
MWDDLGVDKTPTKRPLIPNEQALKDTVKEPEEGSESD